MLQPFPNSQTPARARQVCLEMHSPPWENPLERVRIFTFLEWKVKRERIKKKKKIKLNYVMHSSIRTFTQNLILDITLYYYQQMSFLPCVQQRTALCHAALGKLLFLEGPSCPQLENKVWTQLLKYLPTPIVHTHLLAPSVLKHDSAPQNSLCNGKT